MEVIWKFFTSIIHNCLCSTIILHDVLHGFSQWWVTGTATLEENLVQHISGICHKPLFQLLLYMCKPYEFLDQTICMELLKVCGLGKKLSRLLQLFWEDQVVVSKVGRC